MIRIAPINPGERCRVIGSHRDAIAFLRLAGRYSIYIMIWLVSNLV